MDWTAAARVTECARSRSTADIGHPPFERLAAAFSLLGGVSEIIVTSDVHSPTLWDGVGIIRREQRDAMCAARPPCTFDWIGFVIVTRDEQNTSARVIQDARDRTSV